MAPPGARMDDGGDPAGDKVWQIGVGLLRAGLPAKAASAFALALRLQPDREAVRGDLIHARRAACDWRDYDEGESWLSQAVARGIPIAPFHALNAAGLTPAQHLDVARRRGMIYASSPRRHAPRRSGRIRLGYLSADFRRHATAYLIRDLIERHDRRRFEVVGYDIGQADESAERAGILAAFDRVVDLNPLDDDGAADRIQADGLDILIDLKGYTAGARPGILARRPAVVQIGYLGYPGSMGAGFIDYVLADPFVLPMDQQGHYDERILHLPHCYQPNDPLRHRHGPGPGRAAYGLPEDAFVFCCFNGTAKLTPCFFDIWMRLLAGIPGSVLWLLAAGIAADNLRQAASERGIDPRRLVCAPMRPGTEHLQRFEAADLFLDTLPYNAHTTAADALWEGLPLVTWAGDSFAGRVAGSLLSAAGLPELITSSATEYEALALDLARDPVRLAAMRRHLRSRQAPLFDMARQTRDIEAVYDKIVRPYSSAE